MRTIESLPLLSSAVILVFAWLVFRRYRSRGGVHLLIWGVGLLMFGTAALSEVYSTLGWHPLVFRLWYLGGAVLSAAWIGQGTVYLLAGVRLPNLLASLLLGYGAAVAVFILLGRAGLSVGSVAVLIAVGGLVVAGVLHRVLVRRWNPRQLANGLTWLLIAGSLVAAYFVFSVPLDGSRFDPGRALSAQYREILPPGAVIRKLTPAFNIYGTITLVGGALYSAWLLWRREVQPQRVLGNVLIAAGAVAIASASTMVRLGFGDFLYVGELLAATLMFSGFLLATSRVAAASAEAARA